ncbi:MAG: two-component regulator propeller domain-containing protein, partial [Duganella sp.]
MPVLLLWGVGGAAAWGGPPPRTLRFEQLGVEHGLAQESVLAIAQDRQGFMWLGTQAGLTRFDGYRTVTYKSAVSDPDSLADNWVRVLHLDPSGRLWVGTDGGLDRYDAATRTFEHFVPQEPAQRGNGNRHVRAIADDGLGGLWIATADGLHHFDPASRRFTGWHHDPADAGSLANDQVNALARDAAGRLWVATATGLDMLAPGASGFKHYKVDGGSDGRFNAVLALQVDSNQTLWVGTMGGLEQWRLARNAGDEPQRRRLGDSEGLRPGMSITTLYEDVEKQLWVGTQADGLLRWMPDDQRLVQYRHQFNDHHSLADNQVSALFRDRVGTFWVGTWNDGASRVDMGSGGFARIVRHMDESDALSDNKVRAIVADQGSKLWLGSGAGLNLYDPLTGRSQVWRHDPARPNSLSDDQVTALWRSPGGKGDGSLWIGGRAGVNHLDVATGKLRALSFVRGDPASDTIRNIVADRAGMLWIASRGGLHRLDPQTMDVHTFRHDPADVNSLADNVVRPILEDRRGRLWVGSFNGLDLLDRKTGKFRHFRRDPGDPNSLSHDEVHSLHEDERGTLWVGTAAGLNRMDEAPDGAIRFRRYLRKDGIADDAIASILPDDAGNLWLSTNSGLSRFNIATGMVRNYGDADGTIEGAYFDGSALRAADGTLYFGGFNGITAFAPRAVRENSVAPPVAITDFQVFNRSLRAGQGEHADVLKTAIEHTGELALRQADSVFSLEFAALHYAAPQRNRFAYQLQGFDEDWVVTDASKRFATYTNLDPGVYVFRVKAANKDGVWNDNAATLKITILPPFWKTWWFRTVVGLMLLGAGFAAYQARMRRLRRQQQRLEELVGARTAEVQHKNRLLQQQKQELEQRRLEAEAQRAEAEQRRIDTERQKQEVERAHRNISVLSELGREMSATLDMETLMSTLYRHVHHLMNAQIFGIGFVREQEGVIHFPFAVEGGVRTLPYQRRLDDPNQLAVWCLTHRQPLLINDIDAEYGQYMDDSGFRALAPCVREDGARMPVARSMMYAPLVIGDRMVGLLCAQSTERNAYRQVHMDMLQTLASHAAAGLENARAYQQLEDTLQTLRQTQDQLLLQERQVRLHTEELALANRALQENDERLRHAKQKAEDATRQKSEFLANMSHEMRTPLAGVIGMLGFSLRDNTLQDTTREQILRGQANAQSLLTIINDLLDFSKIEAGKLTIENIDFSLTSAVENVVSLFEEQAAAHSVGFRLVFGDDLPQFVVGDPTRLRQVLVNLVGNAFKFTRSGTVTMRVERVPEDGETPADIAARAGQRGAVNRIRFLVEDTGIGIEAAAIPRLFQKFEQADASTTRRYGGTGLGLAICRQLVELMGGAINAVSAPGQGSTFMFELPLANGVPPPMVPHVPREPHSHQLKVLCAEDFPTNQIIIRMMLEDLGHKVDIAANGALAVKACALTRYDLILMDGRMPELDGAGATRLIRAGGPDDAPVRDQELMIIALTANASEEDRSRYLASGMDDFLTKPIDEDKLHFQLSRAIERQLQRGFQLPRMAPRPGPASASASAPAAAPAAATMADLDALFGVEPAAPDTARLAQHSGGGDLKARLRSAFRQDAPLRMRELEDAMARGDADTAGRLLHGMKGSAGYLEEQEL